MQSLEYDESEKARMRVERERGKGREKAQVLSHPRKHVAACRRELSEKRMGVERER